MATLVVPTCNPGPAFRCFLKSLNCQMVMPDLMLLDSESTDATATLARETGFTVHQIARRAFNHGATRQKGVDLCAAEIVVFMTQDAMLASPDSIANLLRCFEDPKVGAAYGRQLPHGDATPIAAHARIFNYPAASSVRTRDDIPRYGIKTAFISNSFAAYRRGALTEVGGFPSDAIFGEDTIVVAKMLAAGWKVAYRADATCWHSHNYSWAEDFRRYFDIGVFHRREGWFLEALGRAEGEGRKFVISEMSFLLRKAPWLVPSAAVRTFLKLVGYRLGKKEAAIPRWLKRELSMHKGYWKTV